MFCPLNAARRAAPLALILSLALAAIPAAQAGPTAEEYASQVTIIRDEWGVPHIDGPTDAACSFGFAYAQAEDYFWQLEDTFIFALGRYSEVYGENGLDSDIMNRAFEIVKRAKPDFAGMSAYEQDGMEAFTHGVNWYLKSHPEVKPRLLTNFEPWMMMALERHLMVTFLYDKMPMGKGNIHKVADEWRGHVGSNGYAIAGSRTKSGKAMLVANPHQPYFGFGQFIEAHLRSGEGMHVAGASFFGSPIISIGHNERLGWTHTVNEPNLADAWIETFDDPSNPLKYKYGNEYRTAEEWKDTVKIKTKTGIEEREYTFRKTHRGPIVGKKDDTHYYSGRMAMLFEGFRARQWIQMGKAKNYQEWRKAMELLNVPMFNTVYADADGNIFYVFNGAVPKRDPKYNWEAPLDGSDPGTEWGELHPLSELPQTLNPPSGYVQSCNSSPFTTTDDGNPSAKDYPDYITSVDRNDDKRRAKMMRHLLRQTHDITYEQWQDLAFDSTLYWAMTEIPNYKRMLEDEIKAANPSLYEKAKPLMEHLADWDYKVTNDSTQATLCVEWYGMIYEGFYPAEYFKKPYQNDRHARIKGLADAAEKLQGTYGDWKVKWGDICRIQRRANASFGGASDVMKLGFRDNEPSYPLAGAPGPLGEAFTVYFTPPLFGTKKRYAIVGTSFFGAYEFGDKVKAMTLLQFGQSGDPNSPHFMDQAEMMSKKKFKPAYFYWEDVEAHAKLKYHPGQEPKG